MNKVKVPYVLSVLGKVVKPHLTFVGSQYYCPQCFEKLICKKGFPNKIHFSHKRASNCENETVSLQAAKLLIARFFYNRSLFCNHVIKKALSCRDDLMLLRTDLIDTVKIDARVGSNIYDLCFYKKLEPIFAVELTTVQKVEVNKNEPIGIPMIKVALVDILKTSDFIG